MGEKSGIFRTFLTNVVRVADSAPFVAVLILQGQRLVAIAFLRR